LIEVISTNEPIVAVRNKNGVQNVQNSNVFTENEPKSNGRQLHEETPKRTAVMKLDQMHRDDENDQEPQIMIP